MYYKKRHVDRPVLSDNEEVAISVTGLSKTYRINNSPSAPLKEMLSYWLRKRIGLPEKSRAQQFNALSDISFELKKGETVGIVGTNGSGKSTLLQLICGTLIPTQGRVEINGRVAALLELGSGFNPEFSGRENVFMNGMILGLSEEEIHERFDAIHSFSEIGDFIERPVKTYSSGMLVRLAFSVIAHVDANILIIDEALSVGDVFFVQKCMRFLRNFMENGTVLFVSHDMGAVMNLCDRAIWLQSGEMMGQGHPKEISEAYLEQIYTSKSSIAPTQSSENSKGLEVEAQSKKIDTTSKSQVILSQTDFRDMRANFINTTELRNDIEVFYLDETAAQFGSGGAKIIGAQFNDEEGLPIVWIVGGELVQLIIKAKALKNLGNSIVGFILRDRLGQTLFGDNTYIARIDNSNKAVVGQSINAKFIFRMPILPLGDYTISLAIADGTQLEHSVECWLHDAIKFKSHSTSLSNGLIGIPMNEIELNLS